MELSQRRSFEEYLILGPGNCARRVKEQLRKSEARSSGVNFSYVDKDTNIEVDVDAPEIAKFRNRRIDLAEPRVGRILRIGRYGVRREFTGPRGGCDERIWTAEDDRRSPQDDKRVDVHSV